MRFIQLSLVACAIVALAGCYTERDSAGRPYPESGVYRGAEASDQLMAGPNRGVNTNYFGPVNSGTEAAWGPGTPSGALDHTH